MADTLGVSGWWKTSDTVLSGGGWRVRLTSETHRGSEEIHWRAYLPHRKGLIVSGVVLPKGMYINKVIASLPKLIFHHNGELICTEDQFQKAVAIMTEIVDSVAVFEGDRPPYPCRLDFASQVAVDIPGVLSAYEHVKLKGGKKVPAVYPGESLRFRSGDTCFLIYDKISQLRQAGYVFPQDVQSVLRFELQMQSKRAIERAFGRSPVLLENITLDECYRAFRTFVVDRFPDAQISNGWGNMRKSQLCVSLLAELGKKKVMIGSETPMAYALRMLAPSAARCLRREVAAVQLEECNFRPSEVFPESLENLKGVSLCFDGTIPARSATLEPV